MANLSNWYESKPVETQRLIDLVCEKTCFVKTEQQYDEFLTAINQCQIHSAQDFSDLFFAEYQGDSDDVVDIFIKDWLKLAKGCLPTRLLKERKPQHLWKQIVRFDFRKVIVNGNTYFIKRTLS